MHTEKDMESLMVNLQQLQIWRMEKKSITMNFE